MDRIRGANYIEKDGKRIFSDGPPGTIVTQEWTNDVQEELINVINSSGIALDANNRHQVLDAIKLLAKSEAGFQTSMFGMFRFFSLTVPALSSGLCAAAYGLADANNKAIAVGSTLGGSAYLIASSDGETWIRKPNPKSFDLNAACWASSVSLFVAVGGADGTDAYLITSPDGSVWTERANSCNLYLTDVCVAYELSVIVAVGANSAAGGDAYIIRSSTAAIWSQQSNPANYTLQSVCWAASLGLFVAGGGSPTTYIITSPDGEVWTQRYLPFTATRCAPIVWDSVKKMLVGFADLASGYGVPVYSFDGINWEAGNVFVSSPDWVPMLILSVFGLTVIKLSESDSFFFGMNPMGNIIVSPDGMNWELCSDERWYKYNYAGGGQGHQLQFIEEFGYCLHCYDKQLFRSNFINQIYRGTYRAII